MRILFVHEVDWIQKVAFEIHHLSELMSIQGHEVYALDCRNHDLGEFSSAFRTQTIENFNRVYKNARVTLIRPGSISLPVLNRASTFMNFSRVLRHVITKYRIEAILLYSVPTNGLQTLKAAKEFGIPVIFRSIDVLHGLVGYPILKDIVRRMEKTVYTNADKVSAVTSFMAEYAENMGAKKQNISVLSLGANPEVFFPQEKSPELQKKLDMNPNDKVILFVGTLFDFTGLSQVIRDFPKLLDRIPHAKLVIVGGGPSFNNLKKICADAHLEEHIMFTGFVNYQEIPTYINTSDLCINPFEVNYITDRIIPAKLIEYLACGKPVVSTPLKGAQEMLPSMASGVTYSGKDEFVDTIVSVLNNADLMKEMGERGREYVTQHYSWQSIANRLLSEMEDAKAAKVS